MRKENSGQPNQKSADKRVLGFVGLGFDNQDGEQRLTKSEYFFLVGGSPETHEQMQDTAIRFTEALHKRGKRLEQADVQEVIEIFHDTMDS